jgi:hypothetical protein
MALPCVTSRLLDTSADGSVRALRLRVMPSHTDSYHVIKTSKNANKKKTKKQEANWLPPICCNTLKSSKMRFPQQPSEHISCHRNISDQQIRKSNRKVESANIVLCLCASYLLFLPASSALTTLQLVGNKFGSIDPLRKFSKNNVDSCAYRVSSAGNNGFVHSLNRQSLGSRCRRSRHGLCSVAASQVINNNYRPYDT